MNRYLKYLQEIGSAVVSGRFAIVRRRCLSCDAVAPFLISGAESRSIRCLRCRATAISLAVVQQVASLPLDRATGRVYELSYHGAVFRYLRDRFPDFHCSEYFGPPAGGNLVHGIRNEDVQRLSFASGSFDLVSSTEVFEHVPDYMAGFREVARVLRPRGWFVFTVPLFDAAQTKPICRLGSDGRLVWTGLPEYHDSQVTGPGTVPVFWHHSRRQIATDLVHAGFDRAEVVETAHFSRQIPQLVVVAQR